MLSAQPDFMKWYLGVFETIFMAGGVGVASALIVIFFNKLATLNQQWYSWLFSWLIPLICALVLISVVALFPLKISHRIQTLFYVRQNMKENLIEIYYISTIMKIRKENYEKKTQNNASTL